MPEGAALRDSERRRGKCRTCMDAHTECEAGLVPGGPRLGCETSTAGLKSPASARVRAAPYGRALVRRRALRCARNPASQLVCHFC